MPKPKATLELLLKFSFIASLLAVLALPHSAQAQSVVLPKKGMQYFTAGLSLDPGLMYDATAAEVDGLSTTTFASAGMASLGVTQIISRSFFMAAEARAGVQWFDDNTAAKSGRADSSTNFAWQLGLYGQWLPFEDELGLVAAGGLHFFQAHLDDAPLQMLGGDIRLGRYPWTADEDFLLVQFGYTIPLVQGFNRPTDFSGEDPWAERNWTFHRFTFGFQYGF